MMERGEPRARARDGFFCYSRRMPLAPGYFLTWHTYGTWIHGDGAGSVDDSNNEFGAPRLAPDPARFVRAVRRQSSPPFVLSPIARQLVSKVMREHCRIRDWSLRALNVRSNHVHVVLAEPEVPPETIVKQLKEWGTRKLRSHRLAGPSQRVWADHASTIYLFEPGALAKQTHYVNEMQDDPPPGHGRPDWQRTYFPRE